MTEKLNHEALAIVCMITGHRWVALGGLKAGCEKCGALHPDDIRELWARKELRTLSPHSVSLKNLQAIRQSHTEWIAEKIQPSFKDSLQGEGKKPRRRRH